MKYLPIQRYVNADNSCLFSSIAYLLNRQDFNENSALIYRLEIIDYLKNNNVDESLLGYPKDEYIEKISDSNTWGGGIELNIFSNIFKIQIASMDVQSGRVDIFGETKNYDKRIYIVYNGVHYDPLVYNENESSGHDTDLTIFNSNDDTKLIMFKDYVESIRNKFDFISNNLKFLCKVCNNLYNSEITITEHAEKEKHWDFCELN